MPQQPPHRKRVKHFHQPGDLHEFTFSCYRRLPLLTNDDWRRELSRCIDAAAAETQMRLVAFVYMPEHVHLLVDPLEPDPRIPSFLARMKQPLSRYVKGRLIESRSKLLEQLTVQERPGKSCFRFWQEGPGYDRNLNQPDTIAAAIDYVHANPVRRALCRRAVDWPWSSARWYLAQPPREQFPGLPRVEGLRPGTLDRLVL